MTSPIGDILVRLEDIQIPLEAAAAQWWRVNHGITALYLNDIAAGALIEVDGHWPQNTEEATDRVAGGLRFLLQELWRQDLARPVLAVFWVTGDAAGNAPPDAVKADTVKALRKLTWDQDAHRGDFALREAGDESAAKELLWALLGDTMDSLDGSARENKVGLPEVLVALKEELGSAKAAEAPGVQQASARLARMLIEELERVMGTDHVPDLAEAVTGWVQAEGVLS